MRLNLEELPSRLRSTAVDKLPKLIIINGNEPLIIEESLDSLRKELQTHGYNERLKYQLEAGFDWTNLTGAGQVMSLFSERRLLEFRVPKSLGIQGTKAISEYCDKLPEDDVLVIIMPFLDKKQRQAKWLKLADQVGWIADCYEVDSNQLPRWIKNRLQSRALRVENGVVEALSEQLEGNLLAVAQEIDKLQVLSNDGAVPLQLLNESLADQARFDVYSLSDSCLQGNYARTIRIMQRLKSEGLEPVIIVWSLVKEIRTLSAISHGMSIGINKSQLFKQHRIWSKREGIMSAALNRVDNRAWYSILEQAAHLDQSVKGQRYDETGTIWHQIDQLCARICDFNSIDNFSKPSIQV